MNYDEMPADAELDRLVAEKIMGMKAEVCLVASSSGDPRVCMVEGRGHWSPSLSMLHAWEVVEKLRALDRPVSINGGTHLSMPWVVQTLEVKAYAKTAPLAICRAALKAVGDVNMNARRDAVRRLEEIDREISGEP